MSLHVEQVLLTLATSTDIEEHIRLVVFDSILNLLKNHENIETFLLEDALVIFSFMIGQPHVSNRELVKCLQGRSANRSHLPAEHQPNLDSNKYRQRPVRKAEAPGDP